ncbi:hypothetical protein EV383_4470 [Pseudonocardia sediminis]|uniref:Uncharacterized protein n=1 Tax=Pseudonocardia sediminis TaxID=1397368 RepID=A0A4Q7V0E1_PSEST|nr:hypothetical protein [Pseudonocardia sediminis]RZT87545.1 hypothetical protein EV383_4470 [Pseudonocardia sediminis]
MKRSIVHREVTVLLNLAPGEIPDMVKRYGSTVFSPETLTITFQSRETVPEWVVTSATATGGRRLKSGAVSTSDVGFDYRWTTGSDFKNAPAWVMDAIRANTPAPVGDDLPIQHEHVADLPGGA